MSQQPDEKMPQQPNQIYILDEEECKNVRDYCHMIEKKSSLELDVSESSYCSYELKNGLFQCSNLKLVNKTTQCMHCEKVLQVPPNIKDFIPTHIWVQQYTGFTNMYFFCDEQCRWKYLKDPAFEVKLSPELELECMPKICEI